MSVLQVANLHFNSIASNRMDFANGNVNITTTGSFLVNGNTVGSGTGTGLSVIVSNTTPTPAVANSLWWNSDTGKMFIYYNDGTSTQWVAANPEGLVGPTGPRGNIGNTGPIGPKSISIPYPAPSENIIMFYTNTALSLSRITTLLAPASAGQTPTVNVSVKFDANSIAYGALEVISGGIVTQNTTFGQSNTNFNNPTIPARSWVWLDTANTTTNCALLHVTMEFN